jgi:two-component system, chemotaxis family, sensor kinase CheA
MNPLLEQFLFESREFSQGIGEKLMQLENAPSDPDVINELFRLVHTLKGNSGLFTFPGMTRILHAGEDLLGMVRNGRIAYSRELADRLLDAIDFVMALCGDIEKTGDIDVSRAQDSARMAEALRMLMPGATLVDSAGETPSPAKSSTASTGAVRLTLLAEIPEARRMEAFRRCHGGDPLQWIVYAAAKECFFQGDDPFFAARQTPGLLWGKVRTSRPLPPLAELDTYSCALEFHLLTAAPQEELAEHFRYVADQVSMRPVDPLWLVIPQGDPDPAQAEVRFAVEALTHLEAGNISAIRLAAQRVLEGANSGQWLASALPWLLLLLEYVPANRTALRLFIDAIGGSAMPDWKGVTASEANRSTTGMFGALSEQEAAGLERILVAQRQILTFEDRPLWHAGRIKAVATVLDNLSRVVGDSAASSGIEAALAQALHSGHPAPLLEWLDTCGEKLTGVGARQPGSADPTEISTSNGSAETAATPEGGPSKTSACDVPKFGRRAEDGLNGHRSIKVDQVKIDRLMNLIGELVVEKNALPYLAQRAEVQFGNRELSREIKGQYSVINRIADEMQDAIMQVRMMAVSFVFQRFPRLVRDISRKLGKEVQLVLEGEQTEADKNIIESLADPLIHIVRNSLDHGLETPGVRRASGKPETGTLTIRAAQQADRVVIEIIDDGKGIDPDVIKRKAYEKNLIDEAKLERIGDQEAINLIFAAGLSTAEVVSDLSGRGVGMDVVRSAVEKLNGTVVIESQLGKGTSIRISLPLSMAVTQVMVIESDGQLFGVPMDNVVETVRVPRCDIRAIKQSLTAVLRGRIVPLKALNTLLGISAIPRSNPDDELAVLVVRAGNEVFGLIVDGFKETVGVIQKPLGGFLCGLSAYSGSALMGDGSVLMILNIREIV